MIHFKTLTSALILITLLSINNAFAMEREEDSDQVHSKITHPLFQINDEALETVGKNYLEFLRKVGQSDTLVTKEDVSQLFAEQCEKIENGTVLFTSSSALPDQLNTARTAVGKWSLETLWSITSPKDKACIIQFKWRGENLGEHTTMVGLFLDDKGKISQIREVYNEYQKKTLGSPDL